MIGRLLCRLNRHAWDLPHVEHWLVYPASLAYTVPMRVQDCKRRRCYQQRQERVA